MRRSLGALPLAVLWGGPVVLALPFLILPALDGEAWQLLLAHPQLAPGLALSLATGAAATLLALAASLLLLAGLHGSGARRSFEAASAAGLALPHLAFAIGAGFLIMPSGLLARIFVGGGEPPSWISVQDPWGLSLTLGLALKEIPFLTTAAFATLKRGEHAGALEAQCRAARSLGHGPGSAFLRVVLPQLLRQLRWPILAVFTYGATVVDMALVLGPTQPPTMSVVIWHALNDAEPAQNRMGLVGALLLTAALALAAGAAAAMLAALRRPLRRFLTGGPSALGLPRRQAMSLGLALAAVFALSVVMLLMLSVAPRWPYPALLPPGFSGAAWETLAASPNPLWLSLGLGLATSTSAIVIAILWFETQPPARDRWVVGLALASLALPQLALAAGQYRLLLGLHLSGTLAGLFLAHLTPAAAYVVLVLSGPYRGFDMRYMAAARALSASSLRAWLSVKAPLLKAPLLTAGAIGFAVSMAQFVPAQLVAAGRHSTVPMEAVTLSAGGSRPLTAAFALALAAPPLAAFLLAALLGKPRWR
ncbi:hypothetical protein [Aestuariivirga sp.]|uniref:hypothetical protein n=1 Tax=Aestuariivirga sp. TaxID=2650926 RepID=UPI00391B8926